jgi:hypothetical protein
MAYVSPLRQAGQDRAAELASARTRQIMAQAEKAAPLELEKMELGNQAAREAMEQSKVDSFTMRRANAVAEVASAPDLKSVHSTLANLMDDPEVQGNAQAMQGINEMFQMDLPAVKAKAQEAMSNPEFQKLGIKSPYSSSGADLPADVVETIWLSEQTPEMQALHNKQKSGGALTSQEQVDLAKNKEAAVLQARATQDRINAETPGHPDYIKKQEAEVAKQKLKSKQVNDTFKIRSAMGKMDSALKAANAGNTGMMSALFSWVPGTSQHNFSERVQSIEAGLVLETMMTLKSESQHGSTGFGQLNEKELKTMQSAIESVALTQSLDEWKGAMKELQRVYKNQLATTMLALEKPASTIEARRGQAKMAGVADEDIEYLLKFEYPDEYQIGSGKDSASFTGRTARNAEGVVLRETKDGGWVE